MKNILALSLFLCSILIFGQKINWKTPEEADAIQKKNPKKKIFMDVYATWCGPCKMLDAKTFKDKEFVDFINANFIPVKLDAENKSTINFKGNKFKYVSLGRNGYNELAYHILDGRLTFPSTLILNSNMSVENIFTGYYEPKEAISEFKKYVK